MNLENLCLHFCCDNSDVGYGRTKFCTCCCNGGNICFVCCFITEIFFMDGGSWGGEVLVFVDYNKVCILSFLLLHVMEWFFFSSWEKSDARVYLVCFMPLVRVERPITKHKPTTKHPFGARGSWFIEHTQLYGCFRFCLWPNV